MGFKPGFEEAALALDPTGIFNYDRCRLSQLATQISFAKVDVCECEALNVEDSSNVSCLREEAELSEW